MRYYGLVILTLLLPLTALPAKESIFEQLTVVTTDFEFTIEDIPLEVTSQGITLRAVEAEKKYPASSKETQINNFAYRAYHLEFSFNKKYKFPNGFDVVEFYKGNDIIQSISLKASGRNFSAAKGRLHESNFMAVNLRGVPLIMLDSIDRINFRRSK